MTRNQKCALLIAATTAWFVAMAHVAAADVSSKVIGQMPDGTTVDQFTLTNGNGLEVKVLTYGAMITSVKVPDRKGSFDSVTLFLEPPSEYLKRRSVMGTIVG